VFRARAERAGILPLVVVDSAGTHGYHEGEPPDPRSAAVLRRAGYPAEGRARELRAADLRGDAACHLIVCMDRTHERHVLSAGALRERVVLLRSFDAASADRDLADPYYGGDDGFDEMLELIERAMDGLVAHVKAELSARKER
jgi:protein-tyrosine phosphatase